MGGWVKLHRDILSWEWWDEPAMVKAWLTILMLANSEDRKWHGQTVKAGSFVTSRAKLAAALKMTEKQTRTVLSRLKETGEITTQTNNHSTTIIINNWADYQLQNDQQNGQQDLFDNQHLNANFKNHGADKGPTDGRQNDNQRPTKGHKQEIKNIPPIVNKLTIAPQGGPEKPKKKIFVKPTVEEIAAYCRERGNDINPQAFFDHYEAIGWVCGKARSPMKDWKAGVRLWEQYDKKQNQSSTVLREYGFAPDESGTGKAEWETDDA